MRRTMSGGVSRLPIVTTSFAFELTLFLLIVSCAFGAIPTPTFKSASQLPTLSAWLKPDMPASGEMESADWLAIAEFRPVRGVAIGLS
jgi:hypothetical protein